MTGPFFIDQQTVKGEMWEAAMRWVSDNRKLIRQIASPYRSFMAAENADLFQEAAIAAFKAIQAAEKKSKPDQFVPYFRVIFKTNCIKLASGIQTELHTEISNLEGPDPREEAESYESSEVVKKALQTVSKRQREVCLWLLEQPEPVSTPELARKFKISRRHACRLISSSIKRIEGASR